MFRRNVLPQTSQKKGTSNGIPRRWRKNVPPKDRQTFTELQRITFQKTVFYKAPISLTAIAWVYESNEYQVFCLLGYDAVYSAESQPKSRRNMPPPSSGLKNKPSKKPA
jgi:hypothetical protein